jgi:hypothetical protein
LSNKKQIAVLFNKVSQEKNRVPSLTIKDSTNISETLQFAEQRTTPDAEKLEE